MTNNFYIDLKKYIDNSVERLKFEAKQAGIFDNHSDIGTEREKLYCSLFEQHLPKQCRVLFGGYVFSREVKSQGKLI